MTIEMIREIIEGNYSSDIEELVESRTAVMELIQLALTARDLLDDELLVQVLQSGEKSKKLNNGTKVIVKTYESRTQVDREGLKEFVRLNAQAAAVNSDISEAAQTLDYFDQFFRLEPRWGALTEKLGLEQENFCTYELRDSIKIE
tara:strand:+ start:1278 stop:1715 length:438 start_codon:yes stop_codon:yes gene_type:complete